MDEADRAQEIMEQEEALRRRTRRPPGLTYTGYCHWCGDITGGGRRFCDADCRDDWERAQARQNRR
jgi:predicted nucleic acid-binding Zn ribbon protein